MPNAIANRAHLSFAAETAFGGSLSGSTLKQLRFTSESLSLDKNIAHSGQLDPASRNRVDVLELSKKAGGALECELSYTDFITLLQAALGSAPGTPAAGAGTTYKNGNVLTTFYFEKLFADVSRYIGVYAAAINELELKFQANSPVTATFGLMAQKTASLAASRGSGYTAPATDAVMRSGVDVAHLKLNGTPIAAAVKSLSLKLANGLKPTDQLTSDVPTAFQFGDFVVSGSLEAYFPDATVYDVVEASASLPLEIKVQNTAGAFVFALPAARLHGGTPTISGQGGDVMMTIPFLAHQATGGDHTLSILMDPAG